MTRTPTDHGTGEPLLLLGNPADWTPLHDKFLSTNRVVTLDTAATAAHILATLEHLKIPAANIAAFGPATTAALELARAHPAHVLRLASFAHPHPPEAGSDLKQPAIFLAHGDTAEQARALRNLLAQPLSPFETRHLRAAFGSFMTGVTIITTIDETGQPRGFTANSFTSLSIDPPLLLVCVGKKAASHHTFSTRPGFAVNILSEKQKIASGIFASKRPDKFADVAWHEAASGNPLIDGSIAWFDCVRHEVVDAGDHIILIGAIRDFAYHTDTNPLGYARGGYVTLGLEQEAVNAASGGRTVVGAILECNGKLLLARDPGSENFHLPEVGRNGHSGSASLLHEHLRKNGVETDLGFLFAVFENPQNKIQSIYYRGEATLSPDSTYERVAFDALPWHRLPDEATRIMLRRYADERLQGRFKIYSGDHLTGEVRTLD